MLRRTQYITQTDTKVRDTKGKLVGIIRISPPSILWKPRSDQKWLKVSLDDFIEWIHRAAK